jgi:hypothetical protein
MINLTLIYQLIHFCYFHWKFKWFLIGNRMIYKLFLKLITSFKTLIFIILINIQNILWHIHLVYFLLRRCLSDFIRLLTIKTFTMNPTSCILFRVGLFEVAFLLIVYSSIPIGIKLHVSISFS